MARGLFLRDLAMLELDPGDVQCHTRPHGERAAPEGVEDVGSRRLRLIATSAAQVLLSGIRELFLFLAFCIAAVFRRRLS